MDYFLQSKYWKFCPLSNLEDILKVWTLPRIILDAMYSDGVGTLYPQIEYPINPGAVKSVKD